MNNNHNWDTCENIIAIFREDCEINPKIIKHKTSKGKISTPLPHRQ